MTLNDNKWHKNDTKSKNFVDLLCSYVCQYIHSFVLPEISGRGVAPPPKSATASIPVPCLKVFQLRTLAMSGITFL